MSNALLQLMLSAQNSYLLLIELALVPFISLYVFWHFIAGKQNTKNGSFITLNELYIH